MAWNQNEIYQMDMLEAMQDKLYLALKETRDQKTYLSIQMIVKILVDALGADEMSLMMPAIAKEIVRVRENKVESEWMKKSTWADDLLPH